MSDMSYDALSRVTSPKIQGSIHLDKLFQDDSLDFFIFFSSVSSIIGIPGQSAYAAANMFMSSLAERRRQKGLAASVINIGAVLGAGYISRMNIDTSKTKVTMGYTNTSVSDFHQLFAEAVVADGQRKGGEITFGLPLVKRNEPLPPRWVTNPMLTHLIVNTTSANEVSKEKSVEVSLQSQLREAANLNDVTTIVQSAMFKALGSLLQLNTEMMKSLGPSTRLDELGVDSILALELRAWLMENLHFNYPVLKLLSGITLDELVSAAVEGIDTALIPQSEPSLREASSSSLPEPTLVLPPSSESEPMTLSSSTNAHAEQYTSSSGTNPDTMSDNSSLTSLSASWVQDNHDSAFLVESSLSPEQTMFWSALTIFEDKTSLNMSSICSIEGHVDIDRMKEALWNLGQQHEVLRTCFQNRDGVLVQRIMKDSNLKLEQEWVDDDAMLNQMKEEIKHTKYDAERGELVRVVLASTSPSKHFLLFGASHLCMDGTSARIFHVELFRYYSRQLRQHPTIQFRDYVAERQVEFDAGRFDRQLQFWEKQFPDFSPPLPILRVSKVTLRPTLESFRTGTVRAKISLDIKHRVSDVCRRLRVTPFHFYLAVFRVLISRLSDVDDVSIGTMDAGRNDINIGSLGLYANALPLRFRSNVTKKFDQVLQETRKVALDALGNAGVPFQTLVDK